MQADVSTSGMARLGAGLQLDQALPLPTKANPWSLSRVTVPKEGEAPVDQLRVELVELTTGVDPTKHRLTVVKQPNTGALQPAFEVTADGNVHIFHDLKIGGARIEGVLPGSPTTLADLAAEEGDLLAQAQAILNVHTDTDLKGSVALTTPPKPFLAFTITLTATSAVTNVAVYRSVIVGSVVHEKGFLQQGSSVTPATPLTVDGTFNAGLFATGTLIHVVVLAIGVGTDGQPRSAFARLMAAKP
jgi:hypothetical protein